MYRQRITNCISGAESLGKLPAIRGELKKNFECRSPSLMGDLYQKRGEKWPINGGSIVGIRNKSWLGDLKKKV